MVHDPPGRVRVVIADPNPVIRLGVRAALGEHGSFEVVGQATDGAEAVRLARTVRPDVVLLDPGMPDRDELFADLVPLTTVVALTHEQEPELVALAIESGARGYLVHGMYDLEQFAQAVLGAARGLPYASPYAATALVHAVRRRARLVTEGAGTPAADVLSGREREVMRLVADGLTNEGVAVRLGLTEKTVKNHLQSIYTKLDVHSRAAALSTWLGVGPDPGGSGSDWAPRAGPAALPPRPRRP